MTAVNVTDLAPAKRLLTVAQAAERLSVAEWRCYQLIRAKKIPAVRLGRTVHIDADALEAFIANGGTE